MRIAICDDENEWINQIESYIDKIKNTYTDIKYDVFYSGEELLKHYGMYGNIYDIVILDIEMKKMSGIETAHLVREKDSDVIIFFLTNYREYVYDCFKPSPMDFWVKPISYDEFKDGIKRAYKKINSSVEYLRITEKRNKVRIRCNDIIYIENKERKSWIYTTDKIHTTNKLLSELRQELNDKIFVRVYKSYIVNLAYIHIIKEDELILFDSEEKIPISRTYKTNLIESYMSFKEKENF